MFMLLQISFLRERELLSSCDAKALSQASEEEARRSPGDDIALLWFVLLGP